MLLLPIVVQQHVPGDSAQPGADLTAAVIAADALHRLIEGLLSQLLRKLRRAGLGQQEAIHSLRILAVDPVQIGHVSHPLLLCSCLKGGFRYSFCLKKEKFSIG